MKIFFIIFILFFSFNLVADDISDFEIEGISINDSLLDYMEKDKIISMIKLTRSMYDYLSEDFGEVYLYGEFNSYDYIAFMVKPTDLSYKIYQIKGVKIFNNNINECYNLRTKINNEFSSLLNEVEIFDERSDFYKIDPSGKSYKETTFFQFISGDAIRVECTIIDKKIREENNYDQGLTVVLSKKIVIDWLRNY